MRKVKWHFSLFFLAILFLFSCSIQGDKETVTWESIEFKAKEKTVEAERGSFKVLENRSNPDSRPIKLTFVRFESTSDNPGAPIVYLAGGPGGSG
ncbi:hypothetical protein KGY73_11340 [bacterium]|nr:hypothetical protein [bacterium]